ncbi:MAG: hypothetical protein U5K55_06180, partial [Aliarcobacter sp.]|nr:hypothetical protein [Aliarcobacter sp.]
ATDALAIEGVVNDTVVFTVSQTNESNNSTVANFKLTLNELEIADIASVKITDGDGTVTTLTTPSEIQALVDTGVNLTIDANTAQTPTVEITPVDDVIYETSEAFGSVITTSSDVIMGTSTATAAIDDEDKDGDTPPDDKDGDKPTLNLVATDALAIEGVVNDTVVFTVSQTNESNNSTVANFKLTLNELEIADIASVKITDGDGTVTTLTTPSEIQALVDTGVNLTIDANTAQTPTVEITPVDDVIYETSEAFGSVITTSSDVIMGTSTATAAIDDEDKDGDTPPDDKDGDKPTLNLVATDNRAVEGTDNNTIVYTVSQTNLSNFDTTVDLAITLNEVEVSDITSITYTNSTGTVVTLSDSTAINNFVTNGTTLKIESGQTSAPVITITVSDDTIYEIEESLSMSISNPTNATLGTSTDTATIEDEDKDNPTTDTPPNGKDGDKPTLSVSSITVTEGTDSYAQFTVSLSNESIQDVVFNLSLADIEALGLGTDYGSASATNIQVSYDNGIIWSNATSATIVAGSTSVLIRTPILDDSIDENNETFKLITTVTSGDVMNNTNPFGIGTIIDNDTNVVIGAPLGGTIDEDDLSDGSDSSKESLIVTKTLDVTAGTDTFDIKFDNIIDGQDSGLTQDGSTIYYYLDASSHVLTASTSNSEGGVTINNTIFTNTINNPTSGSASYTFELKDALDHVSGNGENSKDLSFDIIATQNNGYTTTDSFTVSVIDDVPTVYDSNDSVFIGPKTTNLVLILDASGSMAFNFASNSGSSNERMNALKASAKAMIDGYSELGNVNVMITYFSGSNIVTFTQSGQMTNTQASWDGTGSSIWLNSTSAKTKVDSINPSSGTYYKEAMDLTSEAFSASSGAGNNPDADFTYVYFMSDGDPTSGHEPTLSTLWDDFINAKDAQGNYVVDGFNAIGITANVATSHLSVVAGTDAGNILGLDRDGSVDTVTSAAEMETILLGKTNVTITGNIFTDGTVTLIGEGADTSYVTSIVIGAKTYAYNGTLITDGSITIGTGSVMTDIETTLTNGSNGIGSKITIDFETGEYSYTINSTLAGAEYSETFNTTVIDKDGDITTKDIIIKVNTSKTGTTGDDTMLFDDTQALDFLAGNDSLVLDSGINLDFDTKNAPINNVEKLDLNANGNHIVNNLGIQDVIDITDSNNILQILGNSLDSVNLKNGDGGNWVDSGTNETIAGQDYDIYTKSGDSGAVTLKIDTDITTHII